MLVELYDVARLMRTRFDRWARTYGMTRAQGVILARLSRQPGMTQNEMAGLCEVEPITVGRLVDRLEARGLLERRLDPSDRRIRRLHLLPASEPILKEIQRYKEELFREITEGLDEPTVELVTDALLKMKTQLTSGDAGQDPGGGRINVICQQHGLATRRPAKVGWAPCGRTRRLRRILMLWAWEYSGRRHLLSDGNIISADDAYVHANKLMVSTDVSGLVESVKVHEGQTVKAGDILFTLDPKPFQIALENAQANLASTVQDVESTRAAYRSAVAQINAQQAMAKMNSQTYARYEALAKQNAIAAMQVDTQRAAMLNADAMTASLRQQAATQLAKLNGDPNLPAEKAPAYLKAKAAVDEAQRQLDHAVVRAPFSGTVGEVDSLQPGTLVISAMSAFTTTSAVGLIGNKLWISADMKETDLTHVRDGAPVDIRIDTYPGCKWDGHVDSVSAGSDSAFSALPAENASGNWVKVVQRIPVRIAIDKSECTRPLRAGMSAVITIDTGKRRITRLLDEGL
ncbi:MAG: biotin/lipoyl-binding protein [Alphaproteobacteria bacterium]